MVRPGDTGDDLAAEGANIYYQCSVPPQIG